MNAMKQSFSSKESDKMNGVIAGAFFIAATTTAIIGLKLYDPVLQHADYLTHGATHAKQVILGAVFELLLAVANIGTALSLYPYLRKYNESLGLGYVAFRMLEVVLILIGAVSILGMVSLTQNYSVAHAADVSSFKAVGDTLKAIHDWTFIIGPNFLLGINTFIYSYVFYRSGLVPRRLAKFGMTGAVSVFIAAILELFGVTPQWTIPAMLMAMPIAVYEMVLAGWLIAKGFDSDPLMQSVPHTSEAAFAVA
jgi:hypothetical protein